MTRYVGIDYGTKRIGLAVGDANGKIATPLSTIQARGSLADHVRAVADYASDYDVDAFVVGLPLNMDDTEGKQAKISRAFGEQLAKVTGLPAHYHDERLSSAAARELLLPAELTRKKRKARLDAVAAQVMLQCFLDSLSTKDVTDDE